LFLGAALGENRSPAKNRSSAAIFRAVVESNGRIAQCEAQAILPSIAMPDSPRLHQKTNAQSGVLFFGSKLGENRNPKCKSRRVDFSGRAQHNSVR
jgi:hypothetical protein